MTDCKITGDIKKFGMITSKDGKQTLKVSGNIEISDSYHSTTELYAHRMLLFIALMKCNKSLSWRSKLNSDGTSWDGYFVAGMRLPTGPITYHIDLKFWEMLDDIETIEMGEWDGHTAEDVIRRINNYCFTL